jgi:hypothetical protein
MEGVCPPFLFNLFFMALYYDLPVFKEAYKPRSRHALHGGYLHRIQTIS